MITASLLKCGITNNLDGSQDELVYNSTENTLKTYLNWTASWNLRVCCLKTLNILLKSKAIAMQ